MRLVSVNVGLPRAVLFQGERVETSIFKSPLSGPVAVRRLNLDGDRQADLTVHGGVDKAVYAYPLEHYAYWREELPELDFPWGAFGENLTVEGLLESELSIGDRLRIGSAEFQVTQPRMPCFKLAIRFGRADMVKRFMLSRRSGFYLSVVSEGEVTAGDELRVIAREADSLSVADIAALYATKGSADLLTRASELQALPHGLREHFRRRLG
jgi:MOSC domain-containing protein YiiM